MKVSLTFYSLLVTFIVSSQTAHIGFNKNGLLIPHSSTGYNVLEKSLIGGPDIYAASTTGSRLTDKKDSALPVSIDGKLLPQNTATSANHINIVFNSSPGGLVTTLAGGMLSGDKNAVGEAALFNFPLAVVADVTGNVYVADAGNNKIKKINASGEVSTFAGSGKAGFADGTDRAAFRYPCGLAVDASGNIYVADKGNHRIRKIAPDGLVMTLAGSGARADIDGPGNLACFDKPVSVAVDATGSLYVADQCNHKIRKITPAGIVTTFAGNGKPGTADGIGTQASFSDPVSVAVDGAGNVYVADYGNNRIRKITPAGLVTTLTGSNTIGSADGPADAATFYFPTALAIDANGNVYIADQINNKIRKLTPAGLVSTIAGSGSTGSKDGYGTKASFNNPSGIAIDTAGYIYVADFNNHKIRKIDPAALEDNKHKENAGLQEVNSLHTFARQVNPALDITHVSIP